jgi:hypothetical protein
MDDIEPQLGRHSFNPQLARALTLPRFAWHDVDKSALFEQ